MEKLIVVDNPVLEASSCHLDHPCYRIKQETAQSLGQVMPYLNATQKVLSYEPDVPVLIFRMDKYRVAVRENELTVGAVSHRDEGMEAISRAAELINDVWKRRSEIKGDATPKKQMPAMEIYKLLPRTNCGDCGEQACLAFAAKLSLGEAELDACRHLKERPEARERPLDMLGL